MDSLPNDLYNENGVNNSNLLHYLNHLTNLSAYQSLSWRQARYFVNFNRDYCNTNCNYNCFSNSNSIRHSFRNHSNSTTSHHAAHDTFNTRGRGKHNCTVTPQVNNSGHNSSTIVRYSARKRREALGKECFCGWSLAVIALDVPKKLFNHFGHSSAPNTASAGAPGTNGKEVLTISLWMNLVPRVDDGPGSSPNNNTSDHGSVTIKSHVNHKTMRSTSFAPGCKVTVKPIAPDEIHLFSLAHGNVALEIWLNLKRDRLKFRLLCTKYWLVLGEAEEAVDLLNVESINHASSNSSTTSRISNSKSASSSPSPSSKSTSSFKGTTKSAKSFNFTSPIKSSFSCLQAASTSEKWHHLALTVEFGKQGRKEGLLSISVILNGFNRSNTNIENFNDEFNPVTSKSDVVLLLGTTSLPDQISTLQLTSLKLLAEKLTQMDCIFLYLFGPNHENLTTNWNEKFDIETFKLPIQLPNIDIDTCYNLVDVFTNEKYQSDFYTKLTSNCLLEFPILKRDFNAKEQHSQVTSSLKCLLYSPKLDSLHIASVSNVLILSFFEPCQRSSVLGDESDIHFKLNDSISVESLLFLTGKLLESTYSSPSTQSEILTTFFNIVTCNSQFFKSFVNLQGYAMVNEMLKGVRFNDASGVLSVYFDHCTLVTQSNCNLLLRCASALVHWFKCWKIWHSNSDSISLLYIKLLTLLDQGNIWHKINVFIIQQSTLLDEIFAMLQVSFFERNTLPNFTFNGTHVSLLKQIIGKIISTPPNLVLLQKLVNCLLLLHDSNRAYVCQSRQSFYFLIPKVLLTKATTDENSRPGSTSDSGLSSDTWQVIRTASDNAAHETIHTLIFTGLLRCLTKILGDLPSGQLESVLGPIIKIDYLLVWANVENATVREVVLHTLTTCLRKSSANFFIKDFTFKGGFQILSNQLSQYKLTCETISILSNFILDTEAIDLASNDEWIHSRNWARLTSIQASAFTCIMSQILKSIDETSTCHWSLLIFTRLLSCIPLASPVLEYLIDHGIVNFCANVIYTTTQLLANGTSGSTGDQVIKCPDILLDQDVILKDINGILEIIAYKLISSTGNVFFEAYDSSLNLFIVLSKSTSVDTNAFRDGLISLLKGAFDAIEKYSSLLSDKSSFRVDSTLHSVNHQNHNIGNTKSNSIGHLDDTYRTPTTVDEMSNMSNTSSFMPSAQLSQVNLSKGELNERNSHLLKRSVEAIGFREPGSVCSEDERYFCRTLLHTLFKKSLSSDSKDRPKWPFLNRSRSIKAKLGNLLLFILSPLYNLDERTQFAKWISSNLYDFTVYLNQKQNQIVQAFAKCILLHCHSIQQFTEMNLQSNISPSHPICTSSSPDAAALGAIERAFLNGQQNNVKQVKQLNDFNEIKWLSDFCKRNEPLVAVYSNKVDTFNRQFETSAANLIELAMAITQTFVEDQNKQRSCFFDRAKDDSTNSYMCKKKWKSIVKSLTHEENFFYDETFFPHSWQLDPTEGPSRMRRKLKRCHLNIPSQFFQETHKHKSRMQPVPWPLAGILSTNGIESETGILIDLAHLNEQMQLTTVVTLITPQTEYFGELLLSETCVHFIGRCKSIREHEVPFNITIKETWYLSEILEYLEQRHQLQDVALEIFLENGNSYLFAFQSSEERQTVKKFFYQHGLSQTTEIKSLTRITKLWRDGHLTNFDYLMFLNKLAGRSFNDLMIYPVYPFVLADYKSDCIDLANGDFYRNLSKPMSIQNKGKERYYKEQYSYLLSEYTRKVNDPIEGPTVDPVSCPVYHYGSHYSNSGIVLHFLVRLPPFTQMFLEYQDRSFDLPDRTFHSINIAWSLSSNDSSSDFKELTPEFFYLPEFLINFEHFNFGKRLNGIPVDDVILPNWCRKDPRLFVLINRQALESDFVSRNLHHWIDLIFGYKQSGPAAIDAVNIFHPATYYGLEVNKITDSLKRNALLTMIRTFGQMPKQLFNHPHPQIGQNTSANVLPSNSPNANCEVGSLKWGSFVGSPTEPEPVVVFKKLNSTLRGSLVPLKTDDIFGLPPNSCLLVSYNTFKKAVNTTYVSSLAILSWKHCDGLIRVRDRRDRTSAPFIGLPLDAIALCATLSSYELLFVAYISGKIAVYSVRPPFDLTHGLRSLEKPIAHLYGHTNPITCLILNREFRIAVSADADGKCILWDLNSLEFVRKLKFQHENSVDVIAISSTLGDIATVSTDRRIYKSRLFVTTINDSPIGDMETDVPINSLCYSSCPEGVSVNVLVTGFDNGTIKMWSSWDLTPVRTICDATYSKPITSMCFFSKCDYLCVVNSEGELRIYGKTGKQPVTSNPVTIL